MLYTCFKRNLTKELKVAQLAGSVAELSAYHHGEASLMGENNRLMINQLIYSNLYKYLISRPLSLPGTIINLAQDYVGSNNLNLLQPIGQFGTRLHGGKDSASPRYIFTALRLANGGLTKPYCAKTISN